MLSRYQILVTANGVSGATLYKTVVDYLNEYRVL